MPSPPVTKFVELVPTMSIIVYFEDQGGAGGGKFEQHQRVCGHAWTQGRPTTLVASSVGPERCKIVYHVLGEQFDSFFLGGRLIPASPIIETKHIQKQFVSML